MEQQLEIGVETFGDVTEGPDGSLLHHAQVLRDVVEEGVAAEQAGLDFFGATFTVYAKLGSVSRAKLAAVPTSWPANPLLMRGPPIPPRRWMA